MDGRDWMAYARLSSYEDKTQDNLCLRLSPCPPHHTLFWGSVGVQGHSHDVKRSGLGSPYRLGRRSCDAGNVGAQIKPGPARAQGIWTDEETDF